MIDKKTESNKTAIKKHPNQYKFFAFTFNNYTEEDVKKFKKFAVSSVVKHFCMGFEEGEKNHTPHLQGCFCLRSRLSYDSVKQKIGIQKEFHLDKTQKAYQANLYYCKKSGNYWEWPSGLPKEFKENQTWEESIQLAKEGRFSEIDIVRYFKHPDKFKKIRAESIPCQNMYLENRFGNFFPCFFLYMWGDTGTGKSARVDKFRFAVNKFREEYCDKNKIKFEEYQQYLKNNNKWLDGYWGQQWVTQEEIEPKWAQLAASNLKKWLDQYPFTAETKGGTIEKMRPQFWVITSNYSLKDLFTDENGVLNEKDYKPIKRRVYEIHIQNRHDDFNWPDFKMLKLYWDTIDIVRAEKEAEYEEFYAKRYASVAEEMKKIQTPTIPIDKQITNIQPTTNEKEKYFKERYEPIKDLMVQSIPRYPTVKSTEVQPPSQDYFDLEASQHYYRTTGYNELPYNMQVDPLGMVTIANNQFVHCLDCNAITQNGLFCEFCSTKILYEDGLERCRSCKRAIPNLVDAHCEECTNYMKQYNPFYQMEKGKYKSNPTVMLIELSLIHI